MPLTQKDFMSDFTHYKTLTTFIKPNKLAEIIHSCYQHLFISYLNSKYNLVLTYNCSWMSLCIISIET